jgi:hypothetical protein
MKQLMLRQYQSLPKLPSTQPNPRSVRKQEGQTSSVNLPSVKSIPDQSTVPLARNVGKQAIIEPQCPLCRFATLKLRPAHVLSRAIYCVLQRQPCLKTETMSHPWP